MHAPRISTSAVRLAAGFAFAIAAVAGRATVRAELLTYEARGTVTEVLNALGPPTGWPPAGTPVVATFTCDSDATPDQYGYLTGGPVHATVADRNWQGSDSQISFSKSATAGGTDTFEVDALRDVTLLPPNDQVLGVDYWDMYLSAAGPGMLGDATGPLPVPDINRARNATLMLWGDTPNNAMPAPVLGVYASLDSVTLVPDPVALPAVGIAALLLLRRRR